MKRLIFSLTVIAALAGCSVVPQQAWTYDGTHPVARIAADAATVAPLTNRVAELQNELNAVRADIAAQPDTPHRLDFYPREHRIGMQLSRAQRELAQYASAR